MRKKQHRSNRQIILKMSLLILFITSWSTSQGQHLIRNQGFFYGLEAVYGHAIQMHSDYIIDTDAYSPTGYGLKASANWFMNYNLSVGAGLGLLNYESPNMFTFPVTVNSQAYLNKGSNTPLAYVEAGYGVRFNHRTQDQGLLYEAGFGYRYRIKWRSFLVFKVGYHNYTNNEWLWKRKVDGSATPEDPFQWFDLKRQSITFTVGFYYSTRY